MTDWMVHNKAVEHLRDLLALEDGLTEWEVEFVEKMAALNRPFTKAEMKKIYDIYQERC